MNQFCWFVLFISVSVTAQTKTDVHLKEIQQGFWQVVSYGEYKNQLFEANSMLVETDDQLILIDTPWSVEATENLLKKTETQFNKPIKLAVITHWHDDSSAGLKVLQNKGINTLAHYKTWRQLFKQNLAKSTDSVMYKNNHLLDIDGKRIKLYYPGEAHTKDNIVVFFPDDQLLFAGCMLKSKSFTDLGFIGDSNLQRWPYSIRKMQTNFALPFKKVLMLSGHGNADYDLIKHTLKLLKQHRKRN